MANPYAKYVTQQSPGVFTLPPSPQEERDNARQDRNDSRVAAVEAARLEIERERLRMAQVEASKKQAEEAETARKSALVRDESAGELSRIMGLLDEVKADANDNGGWFETGLSGSFMREIPGTAARGLQRQIDTIDANAAFSKLAEMRQNSPTGGALGAIAVPELMMLKSSIASLDPNQPHSDFNRSIDRARNVYAGMIGRVDPVAGRVARATNPKLNATGGMNALERGYRSLLDQTKNYTPEQRAAALRAYDADPAVQALKSRAGFRDPGGRASIAGAPRRGGQSGAWWDNSAGRAPRKADDIPDDIKAIAARLEGR